MTIPACSDVIRCLADPGAFAKDTPCSPEYLNPLARRGVLDAVKVGRVWMSTKP